MLFVDLITSRLVNVSDYLTTSISLWEAVPSFTHSIKATYSTVFYTVSERAFMLQFWIIRSGPICQPMKLLAGFYFKSICDCFLNRKRWSRNGLTVIVTLASQVVRILSVALNTVLTNFTAGREKTIRSFDLKLKLLVSAERKTMIKFRPFKFEIIFAAHIWNGLALNWKDYLGLK